MPAPRYEALPAPNTPEFRELARELGDALGPLGSAQTGEFTGAPNPDDAFALLARFSPADRLTLTRGALRITGGETGRDLAALPDRNIMLLLTNKFSTSSTGTTRSYEGLEQALRLFADMPVNRQTTANLNTIIQAVILDGGGESNFLTSSDAARDRRAVFFAGTGIQEDDRGNPYQRLRLIGIIPGRLPVVDAPAAMMFDQNSALLTAQIVALAKINASLNAPPAPLTGGAIVVGGINVGGSSTSFSSFAFSHTQISLVGGTQQTSSGAVVQLNAGGVLAPPALVTL